MRGPEARTTPPAPFGGGRMVDLTLLLSEELPCWWSTHMPFQHKTSNYFTDRPDDAAPLLSRSGPYRTRWLLVDEHTGTHLDAPAHFVPLPGFGIAHAGEAGRTTVDRVPLEQLTGPAAVIDVPDDLPGAAPRVNPVIGPELLEEHEREFGPVTAGTVVGPGGRRRGGRRGRSVSARVVPGPASRRSEEGGDEHAAAGRRRASWLSSCGRASPAPAPTGGSASR